jgi:lipoprotein-anchoring transpeptidase ErfK/SrfK
MSSAKRVASFTVLVLLVAGAYCAYQYYRMRNWRVGYEKALRLQGDRRYAEAADLFLDAYNCCPLPREKMESLYRHCASLDAAGQRERAGAGWKKILSSPTAEKYHPCAMLALARKAVADNRTAEARGYLDTFSGAHPDTALLGDAWCTRAELLQREGDLPGAWHAAQKVVAEYPGSASSGRAQEIAGELYMKLLFSGQLIPGTEEYVVRPGDSLQSIAKKHGTTVDLLREMNKQSVRGDSIQPGRRLKVYIESFSLLVDKSSNTLTLKAGERPVKIYSVGTGKQGSTPVGEFAIVNKMEKPEWFKPGAGVIPYREPKGPGDVPENLLGTRWMGIDSPGYGIHGTWEPETIGKQASAGCIRLLNKDVEELYTIVPVGTRVEIVE